MYASENNAEIFRNTQNFLVEVDLNSSERRYPPHTFHTLTFHSRPLKRTASNHQNLHGL